MLNPKLETLNSKQTQMSKPQNSKPYDLCTAVSIIAKEVIPAQAGIQENTGFRVKPGMTS
jgi:hypothetical protein